MKIVPAASLALAGGAALALKWQCASASADELGWILAPTVAIVQAVTGFSFVREAGTGWWSDELRYSIAPVCAGVNFLVVVFLSIAFALLRDETRHTHTLPKLAGAALAAWAVTILANAARLALALTLRANDVHAADGESAHRTLGILVYLPTLFLVFELASRASERSETSSRRRASVRVGAFGASLASGTGSGSGPEHGHVLVGGHPGTGRGPCP